MSGLRILVAPAVALVGIWLLVGALSRGVSAAPSGVVTVCLDGPLVCDYQAVQAGIDAASAGDTVLVYPGTYVEQVALRSGVTLASTDGPTVTAITAPVMPVVRASGVLSAAVHGFDISGQAAVTAAVGIEIISSELTLVDCVIHGVRGTDGDGAHWNGWGSVGIRATGVSTLTLQGSAVYDVQGGDGLSSDFNAGTGAEAIGILMVGGRLAILDSTIHHIFGGDGGSAYEDMWGGTGGAAVGVRTSGVDLIFERARVETVSGGGGGLMWGPCMIFAPSGASAGIRADGGTIILRDSRLALLRYSGAPRYGLRAVGVSTTHVERSVFLGSGYVGSQTEYVGEEKTIAAVPCPPRPAANEIAVDSEQGMVLQVVGAVVSDLDSSGLYGQGVAVRARGVQRVTLSGNTITGLVGGYGSAINAAGIWVEGAEWAEVDTNAVSGIVGQDGFDSYYGLSPPQAGGGAVGVWLHGVGASRVTNNVIWSLAGGDGGSCNGWPYCDARMAGGDAMALSVIDASAGIWNNTFYGTAAGDGGAPGEQAGRAAGVGVAGDADVLVVNNALVGHGAGVLSDGQVAPLLWHNALWDNGEDYVGVSPGVGDLYVDPAFVDAENGDFHLRPDSPLIDVGSNVEAPDVDFEGEPRPVDGDGDGDVRADVGADELWPGLAGSVKTAYPLVVASGDAVTYQLVLANPDRWRDLPGVRLTDTLPVSVTYVGGTLWGTAGDWGCTGDVVTWTGDVAAGEAVTLTFAVVVDGGLVGPQEIVNRAVLDDGVGQQPQALEVAVLVNPLRRHLPIFYGWGS